MVKFWGRPPKGGRPHEGVKYKIFVFNKLIFFVVSLTSLQLTTSIAPMQIMAQNTCSGVRKCLWGV